MPCIESRLLDVTSRLLPLAAVGVAGYGAACALTFLRRWAWNRSAKRLYNKSLISVDSLSTANLDVIMRVAEKCKELVLGKGKCFILKDRIMAALFFEPSTRTRCSFEAAMQRLGGTVILQDNMTTSSVSKGETLEDTVRMFSSYCDVIVMRHNLKGTAARAVQASSVPILNAGDGTGEHPTQALLDFFTIRSFFPNIQRDASGEALRVAFVGDLKHGRTVHSLSRLLSRYNVAFKHVSPEQLRLTDDFMRELDETFQKHNRDPKARQGCYDSLQEVLPMSDVLYMTRVQKERFATPQEYARVKDSYILTASLLDAYSPAHQKILHPLPRVNEIHTDVDRNIRSAYFEQAQNGLFVRMALLLVVFGKSAEVLFPYPSPKEAFLSLFSVLTWPLWSPSEGKRAATGAGEGAELPLPTARPRTQTV